MGVPVISLPQDSVSPPANRGVDLRSPGAPQARVSPSRNGVMGKERTFSRKTGGIPSGTEPFCFAKPLGGPEPGCLEQGDKGTAKRLGSLAPRVA